MTVALAGPRANHISGNEAKLTIPVAPTNLPSTNAVDLVPCADAKATPLRTLGEWTRRSARVQGGASTHEVANNWLASEHAGSHDLASSRFSDLTPVPLPVDHRSPALLHEGTRRLKKGAMASMCRVAKR